ncbi:MAG: multiheme c-type cytochrome [Desulfobacterales bacterium]|nr:multiheme c-type cytochrome [Desulfobacterales bacterium]
MRLKYMYQKKCSWRTWFISIVMLVVVNLALSGSVFAMDQAAKSLTELPAPDLPQPQFFCGYCHVLTYPGIVNKGYELWKKGKHNKYGCVECHYPPGKAGRLGVTPTAGNESKIKHIPIKDLIKEPPAHFSYLQLGGEVVRTRPRVVDASCMTANCHGNPKDEFKTKKIKFTDKVSFVHKPHLEKKNQIEGQAINCTSCHQHETDQKKFEVSQAACHQCHFTNVKFNEGRGRCELCHALPEKPIQTSGEKPITHEMLKKANVSCSSCHIEMIQASGGGRYEAFFEKGELKTTLVLGAGRIKNEACLACHDQAKALKEVKNKKLMHEKHVTTKNARCFECHRPIMHTKANLERPLDSQPERISCEACHFSPHRLQRLLVSGPKIEGVLKTPDFMYKVGTNCLGCHVERKHTEKGAKVMTASGKTCVKCHTKDHEKMLKEWKTELVKNIKEAREIEQEALETLAKYKSRLTNDKLAKANQILKQGLDIIDIVQHGNGVHNKKYSIMLIDAAIGFFDDMIAYTEEGK